MSEQNQDAAEDAPADPTPNPDETVSNGTSATDPAESTDESSAEPTDDEGASE